MLKKILSVNKLLLAATLSAGGLEVSAQDMALVPYDEKTLLQRVTDGKRDIDWANMNIQFCTAADAAFTDGTFDEMALSAWKFWELSETSFRIISDNRLTNTQIRTFRWTILPVPWNWLW